MRTSLGSASEFRHFRGSVGLAITLMASALMNAGAQSPAPIIDLSQVGAEVAGVRIMDFVENGRVGRSVTGIPDMNGDGFDEVLIGAPGDFFDSESGGSAFLIFGSASQTPVDLQDLESRGIRFDGESPGDQFGSLVGSPGDINNDGITDLAVGATRSWRNGNSELYIIFGNSNLQSFPLDEIESSNRGYQFGDNFIGQNPDRAFISGHIDFNGDGIDDFMVSTYGSSSPFIGFGGRDLGGFDPSAPGEDGYRLGLGETGVSDTSADLNGDGLGDLILGHEYHDEGILSSSGLAWVVFGRSGFGEINEISGDEGFRIIGTEENGGAGADVSTGGDVNGDGIEDIVIGADGEENSNGTTGKVYVLFGDSQTNDIQLSQIASGDGGFVINGGVYNYFGFTAKIIEDINGDGLDDIMATATSDMIYIVFGKRNTNPVDILELSEVDGLMIDRQSSPFFRSRSNFASANDFNNDGFNDLIIGDPDTSTNDVFRSGQAFVLFGPLAEPQVEPTPTPTPTPTPVGVEARFAEGVSYAAGDGSLGVYAGDLNGDGLPDIATADRRADTVSILYGDGAGGFSPRVVLGTDRGTSHVLAEDIDRDGFVDIAVTCENQNRVNIFYSSDSGYSAPQALGNTRTAPEELTIVDLDGDGNLDIATANRVGDAVSIFYGDGQRGWSTVETISDLNDLLSIDFGDLNADGRPDLVVTEFDPGSVTVLLGAENRVFQAPTNYEALGGVNDVVVRDIDNDGALDIAVSGSRTNDISIFYGDNSGLFPLPVKYITGSGPYGIEAVDLDGDGMLDLATANRWGNSMSVLLQRSAREFSEFVDFPSGMECFKINAADFDQDGDLDLVTADWASDSVTVFLNETEQAITFTDPLGSWSITGTGSGGWVADLQLQRASDDLNGQIPVSGELVWNSSDYSISARDSVTGTYDLETKVLNFAETGGSFGGYTATLSPDGIRLIEGNHFARGPFTASRAGVVASDFESDLEGWERENP